MKADRAAAIEFIENTTREKYSYPALDNLKAAYLEVCAELEAERKSQDAHVSQIKTLQQLLDDERQARESEYANHLRIAEELGKERKAHDGLKRAILDGSHPNLVLERNARRTDAAASDVKIMSLIAAVKAAEARNASVEAETIERCVKALEPANHPMLQAAITVIHNL